jgi:hypothetical protein
MEKSVDQAIKDLKQLFNEKGHRPEPRAYLLRAALLKFYQQRTLEILEHLDENGVGQVISYDNLKIGGTI